MQGTTHGTAHVHGAQQGKAGRQGQGLGKAHHRPPAPTMVMGQFLPPHGQVQWGKGQAGKKWQVAWAPPSPWGQAWMVVGGSGVNAAGRGWGRSQAGGTHALHLGTMVQAGRGQATREHGIVATWHTRHISVPRQ